MNDITWIGEGAADWAAHYGGRVAGAGSAYPPLPGDVIRTAWYMMDGPADRPTTVAECHVFIEQLLAAVG